jgi:uncharacterized protein YdaU (DUF1376 family)
MKLQTPEGKSHDGARHSIQESAARKRRTSHDAPWYKRYPLDFRDGTRGLPLEVRGAYSEIIDLIFARSGPIVDDARSIAHALETDVRKWKHIRQQLLDPEKLYVTADGSLSNHRADEELLLRQQKTIHKPAAARSAHTDRREMSGRL